MKYAHSAVEAALPASISAPPPSGSMSRGFCIVQSKIPASAITTDEYGTLQDAYDHFNAALFADCLPQVLITLQRRRRARGYFSPKKFQSRDKRGRYVHELALNPDSFFGRTDEDILSTLVHEMAHVWQQEFGHPGRGRYHNREWAAKMHAIGLMPSTTGEPGGAVTGECVSHYVLPEGPYVVASHEFLKTYRLVWESATERDEASGSDTRCPPANTKQTRAKFTCPNCGLNVWGKPDALIDCHTCSETARETILMRPIAGNNGAHAHTEGGLRDFADTWPRAMTVNPTCRVKRNRHAKQMDQKD